MADINVKVTFDKINVKEKIQEHKVKILMLIIKAIPISPEWLMV